jgi:hypothetical protein
MYRLYYTFEYNNMLSLLCGVQTIDGIKIAVHVPMLVIAAEGF